MTKTIHGTVEAQIEFYKERIQKLQARERDKQRRAETRRKIQLGGLVIVANAQDLDPAEIVGLLASWGTLSEDVRRKLKEQGIQAMTER